MSISVCDTAAAPDTLFSASPEHLLNRSSATHFFPYKLQQVHSMLRVTPAMESGMANHVWKWQELLATQEQDTTQWFNQNLIFSFHRHNIPFASYFPQSISLPEPASLFGVQS
jgi:hypothetical protein